MDPDHKPRQQTIQERRAGLSESVHQHESGDTTTIEVSKELRDYLRTFGGRNYTERILDMNWHQTCAEADSGKEGGSCTNLASHAKWFHAGPNLFVALPLCEEHLEMCAIPNHDDHYKHD